MTNTLPGGASEAVVSEFQRLLGKRGAGRGNLLTVPAGGEPLHNWPAHNFELLLQALPAALYITDAEGRITFYNEVAVALWEHRPKLGESEWCGSWRLYWPDGTLLPHDKCPMAMALKQGRQIRGKEAIAERPDGTRVPFIAYPTPFHNASGKVIGAVNMLIDISERKAAEEQKDLLLTEMRHRMKNTLTRVTAIGNQTFRNCSDDERSAFASRLQALSSAHELLTERDWKKVSMNEVVIRALQPHRNGDGRFDLSGPDLDIEEKKAVALALALNELATNAQKYGALSAPEGSVKIIWGKAPGKPDCILFRWQEIGALQLNHRNTGASAPALLNAALPENSMP